ncbi:MAG: hypothetical protein LBI39_01320 [Puniceicoccales bacterium]|jgi:hypothetical protein|nr:hypothetical protein [Puniceicoccales bacterium]
MRNFAEQSLDIAQHIGGSLIGQIGEDGRIRELGADQPSELLQPGPMAHALAACVAAGKSNENGGALLDGSARCIAGQFLYHDRKECLAGCAHGALALMTLGLNRSRNEAWAKFPDAIRDRIGRWMRTKENVPLHMRPYAIVRSVVASGMGFSNADESEKLIEDYFKELLASPSGGFIDTALGDEQRGRYDASGLLQLLLLRETLQRHANVHVRERRMHDLRSCAVRYLRLLPHLLQGDGSSWTYGDPSGCLGTVCSCSAIVCALADGWIEPAQRESHLSLLGQLFRTFFFRHFDMESGNIILPQTANGRDPWELSSVETAFAVVHQLAIWNQFARNMREPFQSNGATATSEGGRFTMFESGAKGDRGLMLYGCGASGPSFQLPLVSPPQRNGSTGIAHSAAFPHFAEFSGGLSKFAKPPLLPVVTIGGKSYAPSFFGKNISTSLGASKCFQFRYEQPDVAALDGEVSSGILGCKVQWSFRHDEILGEFTYIPKKLERLERLDYLVPAYGPQNCGEKRTVRLVPKILHDDFQGEWKSGQSRDANGIEMLSYGRMLHMQLQPGSSYRFAVSLAIDRGSDCDGA